MTPRIQPPPPALPPLTPARSADVSHLLDRVHHCDALDLLRALPDASVDAVITDPPYGVGKVSAWRSSDTRFDEIEGNHEIFDGWLAPSYRVLKYGGALYAFAKWQNSGDWKRLIEAAGFSVRNCIIWDKIQHGSGDLQTCYGPQYEMILFAAKGRHLLRGNRPTDIIRYKKIAPEALTHPYEKPVGLIERLIRTSTDAGAIVVDPFAGSGSALKAARILGRHYIGSEIEARYCDQTRKALAHPFDMPTLFTEAV